MGAWMNVDFFGIYETKEDRELALTEATEFAREVDFISIQADDFVRLNDNYLLYKSGGGMPYSDCTVVDGYLSALVMGSLFTVYLLSSDELEVDEVINYSKDEPADTVFRVQSNLRNSTDFASCFRVPETRKVFLNETGNRMSIDTRKITIEGREYTYFDHIPRLFFYGSLLLHDILLFTEGNDVWSVYAYYKPEMIESRRLGSVLEEAFVTDDPSTDSITFIYTGCQDRILCMQYQGRESVTIGAVTYEDCIRIRHVILYWDNTFILGRTPVKDQLAANEEFIQTYWAKDIGLIRILEQMGGRTTVYDCVSISTDFNDTLEEKRPLADPPGPKQKQWWQFWK